MSVDDVVEKRILKLLGKHDYLTIEETASKLGMHRTTASKYLAVLEAKGLVKYRPVGKAKLYSVRR